MPRWDADVKNYSGYISQTFEAVIDPHPCTGSARSALDGGWKFGIAGHQSVVNREMVSV
jgi:hypothetical protein